MKILTEERLSEHRYKTSEGYLVCVDAILARTGSQTYLERELFDDKKDSNQEINVLREPDQVFDEKTIASFENKPITIEHPQDFVNSDNYKDLAVGFVRDVMKKEADGRDLLVGNLIITDEEAIKEIENGKIYLSCGYDCDIIQKDDQWYQTNIRGNHIALCDNPRAGITQIIDSDEGSTNIDESIKKVIDCLHLTLRDETISKEKILSIIEMLKQIYEREQ